MCPGSGSAAVTHRQSLVVAVAMAVPGRGIQGEYEIDAGLEEADDGNPLRHRSVDPRVGEIGCSRQKGRRPPDDRSELFARTVASSCAPSRRRARPEHTARPCALVGDVVEDRAATDGPQALPVHVQRGTFGGGNSPIRAATAANSARADASASARRRRTSPNSARTSTACPRSRRRRRSGVRVRVRPHRRSPGAGRHRDHHVRPAQAARALEFGDREARPGPRLRGRVETDVGPHAARVGDAGDEPATLRAQRRPRDERIRITRRECRVDTATRVSESVAPQHRPLPVRRPRSARSRRECQCGAAQQTETSRDTADSASDREQGQAGDSRPDRHFRQCPAPTGGALIAARTAFCQ